MQSDFIPENRRLWLRLPSVKDIAFSLGDVFMVNPAFDSGAIFGTLIGEGLHRLYVDAGEQEFILNAVCGNFF